MLGSMVSARVRVVGVNDVYGLTELPRLASLVAAQRADAGVDRVLVTVAGDFLAPSLLSSLDAGRGMVDCLNALGATHVTLGNHEDDIAPEQLVLRLSELRAVVLLTNARRFAGRHVPADMVDVHGARIGLVGVVSDDPTQYRGPPFGGAVIGPTNDSVVAEAARLRTEGCVAVIALTHQPLRVDRALADLGVVDLIHGGHEHDGHLELDRRTPIAKAPMNATSVIIADLVVAGGRPTVSVRMEPVAAWPEDPAMRARVDRHLAQVRALEARTLFVLPEGVVLTSARARFEQTSVGTLVASRLRDALGAEVGIFNGGGLRGQNERRGRFTFADLEEEVPFENEVVVASLPGALLRDAVRYSRTVLRGTGGYLQIDDHAVADGPELERLAGAPLDPGRTYRVATVRDLLVGRDHIAPFVERARAFPETVPPATSGIDVKVALLRTFAV